MRRRHPNALSPFVQRLPSLIHTKQAYSFTRVVLNAGLLIPFCLSLGVTAQAGSADLISGKVVSPQGHPAANIDVELRDLRGMRFGSGATNDAGVFAIPAPPERGEYILLASNGPRLVGEQISWRRGEREFTITLPALRVNSGPKPGENTVSVNRLETREKARKYIQRAQTEFAESRVEDALRDLDSLLEEEPRCAAGVTMRALLRLAIKDFSGALDDARRAVALDQDSGQAYIAMATALNSLGEFTKAAEASVQALILDIDSWQARLELAKSLYGKNQFVLALHELDLLRVDFSDVRLVRGNVLARLGRREEARKEFTDFLNNFPDDPRVRQVRQTLAMP